MKLPAPGHDCLYLRFWRSAWKYRERGYRYCYWDNGTILANLAATANTLGLPAEVVAGFVDAEVDALLGLESGSEASFFLVPIGERHAAPLASANALRLIPVRWEWNGAPSTRRHARCT